MKWIKKNKFTCLAIVLFVVIAIVGYKAISVFFPDTDSAIYGDRLDNKVAVKKSAYDSLKAKFSEQEFVKEVSVRENGRTINIIATVNDSTSKDSAKSLAGMVTEHFTEIQIGYYDFQLFIQKEDKSENDFPIIGYKQHNSSEFSWNKDREKTTEGEE